MLPACPIHARTCSFARSSSTRTSTINEQRMSSVNAKRQTPNAERRTITIKGRNLVLVDGNFRINSDSMHFRKLGKTNFDVSEVSLGAWQIGGAWGDVSDAS